MCYSELKLLRFSALNGVAVHDCYAITGSDTRREAATFKVRWAFIFWSFAVLDAMSCLVCFQVLVAVHRIALFGVTLDEERVIKENRDRARMHLSVLKLGVHRFLATGVERCRSCTTAEYSIFRCRKMV